MNTTQMTDAALHYTRLDLGAVIKIQEQTERAAPGSCPKLGRYWDDLHAVLGEIRRRQMAVR